MLLSSFGSFAFNYRAGAWNEAERSYTPARSLCEDRTRELGPAGSSEAEQGESYAEGSYAELARTKLPEQSFPRLRPRRSFTLRSSTALQGRSRSNAMLYRI